MTQDSRPPAATRALAGDAGMVPAVWLRALLDMQRAVNLEPFAHAVQRLVHAAVPPLRAVGVMYHPFEWQWPLLYAEPGEQDDWKKWLDCAEQDDIWLQRWQQSGKSGPNQRVVRHTDHTPDRILVRSKIYRKLMRHHRIRYGCALLVWERSQLRLLVQVLRSTEHGDFTDAEVRSLREIHPHIAVGAGRLLKEHREHAARMTLEQFIAGRAVPMLMLDWHGRVLHHNAAALDALHHWANGPAAARVLKPAEKLELPADLLAECERFRKTCGNGALSLKGEISNWSRPHPSEPGWRCHFQCFSGRPLSHPLFVLRLETSTLSRAARGVTAADEPAMPDQLTPREREVVELVCAGRSNREIATALGKSAATVRNQLHAVFEKLGVARRAELIARWK